LPEYKDAVSKAIDTVMEKGFYSTESTLIAKDGRQIPVFLTGTRFEIQGHLYYMGIGIDITNLKQAEDKLVASERKMHAIFDQTFELIGLMSLDGNLIEVNRAALQFSGIEASAVLNKPFWQGPWWAHSTELQEKIRESVDKAARGEFVRFEATHISKEDGSSHYIDFSLKPVKDEAGKVIFMVPEGRDVTEQKQIEIKLNEKLEELEKLNKFMVDRELKMVELKKEIETLKVQLKNK
jgi:PAS domain S-box-containing protein